MMLPLDLAITVISIISLALIIRVRESDSVFQVKVSIASVVTLSALLAVSNMLDINRDKAAFALVELYLRVSTVIVFIFLIYKAIYGEIREKARRRERELEALNEVALAVGKSMDLKQILHNALLSVMKIGNFGIGFIYLLNRENNMLDLVASHGHVPENLTKRLSCLNLGEEV